MPESRLRRLVVLLLLVPAGIVWAQRGDIINIREESPESYVVVEGDTLWDIAGVFLEEPWQWPRIWRVNPQIENPDLIYPGDLIALSYEDGEPVPTLRRANATDRPEDLTERRLSPEVRREALLSPIPAIALDDISPYLSRNRIVGESELSNSPTVVASRSGKRFSSTGEAVFVSGDLSADAALYDIVRPGRNIEDPATGRTIAIEARLVASASVLERQEGQATLMIEGVQEEVRAGDRVIRAERNTLAPELFPAPPDFEVDARVVDIDFGRFLGGRFDTLVINTGEQSGMNPGMLLTLRKADSVVDNPGGRRILRIDNDNRQLVFPGEIYGRILVYKVFDDHSFALVLNSSLPVEVQDRVITP